MSDEDLDFLDFLDDLSDPNDPIDPDDPDDLVDDDDLETKRLKQKKALEEKAKNKAKGRVALEKERDAKRKERSLIVAEVETKAKNKADIEKTMKAISDPKSTIFEREQKNILSALSKNRTASGVKEFLDTKSIYLADNYLKQYQTFFTPSQKNDWEKSVKAKDFKMLRTIRGHIEDTLSKSTLHNLKKGVAGGLANKDKFYSTTGKMSAKQRAKLLNNQN